MSQETQQRVKVLLQDQAALAAVKVFSQMRSDMGVEEAEAFDTLGQSCEVFEGMLAALPRADEDVGGGD